MMTVPSAATELPFVLRLQNVNERRVLATGIGLFLLVLAFSIATRLYLEIRHGGTNKLGSSSGPNERSLAKGDILVPVTLSLKIVDRRVVLRGTLPTEESHQIVLARAREIYGVKNVEDNLGVQPDIVVTPWFDSVLKWFPPQIEDIRDGELSVNGMNVYLFGEVSSLEARSGAQQKFAKLIGPEGHFSNGLQVKYGPDLANATTTKPPAVTTKDSNQVKPANFRVQF